MFIDFDPKFILALVNIVLVFFAYIPYIKNIFLKKTKPHLITWLIWTITQGVATSAIFYGGGKFGGLSLIIITLLVFFVFILSFKYGVRDMNTGNVISLIIVALAVLVWLKFDMPLISLLIVTIIDGVGYIPTIIKSYTLPSTETISFWIIMAVSDLLSIISNAKYNLLTVTYLAVLLVGNLTVATICITRKSL